MLQIAEPGLSAPSYFSQFFLRQLNNEEEGKPIRTLYIDRDPETFRDIARHLQGYHISPRDGPHFVRLFADSQFYSSWGYSCTSLENVEAWLLSRRDLQRASVSDLELSGEGAAFLFHDSMCLGAAVKVGVCDGAGSSGLSQRQRLSPLSHSSAIFRAAV